MRLGMAGSCWSCRGPGDGGMSFIEAERRMICQKARPECGRWGNTGGKPMTWGQALTGLIVLTVVGAGIAYVVVWLRSHASWAMSRHSIIRGQSSSHDPIVMMMSGAIPTFAEQLAHC